MMLVNNQVRVGFDGKTPYTTKPARLDAAAQLYRDANIPMAKYGYAMMLANNQVSVSFDGKKRYTTEQARSHAAARLLRDANIPMAKYGYAMMLVNNQVRVGFDGKTLYTEQERSNAAAQLYRDANIPITKYVYAGMLLNNHVSIGFDGKTHYTKEEDRLDAAAQLYKDAQIAAAKNSYAVMLLNNQVSVGFNDETHYATEQERFYEAARLLRDAQMPEAKNNYAVMLENNKISIGFDGTTHYTTEQDRLDAAVQLYRDANIPVAKRNILYMILSGFRKTCDGETLGDDRIAYQHVIDTINDPSFPKSKESSILLELAYEKIGDIEEAFNTNKEAEALGEIPSDFETDTSSASDERTDDTREDFNTREQPQKQKGRKETKEAKEIKKRRQAVSEAARQGQQVRQKKQEFDVSDDALAKERAEALQNWKTRMKEETAEHKAKRHARIQPTICVQNAQHDFNSYTQIFENGASIEDIPKSYQKKFHDLIKGIKEKNREGAPHMLSADYAGFKLIARSITKKDRIVYYFDHEQKQIVVVQCSGHYDDT